MRRVIAILLLAFLSLQSAWAVAAAYCQHETKLEVAHFGHHAEQQAEAAAPADDGDGSAAERHCHDCHAACAYLARPAVPAHLDMMGAVPLRALAPRLPSPPSSPLDRPDWQALA